MILRRQGLKERPSLYLVGQSGETGYGRVCDALAPILAESFDLTHIVLNKPTIRRSSRGYVLMQNTSGDLTGSERLRELWQRGDAADMLIVSDWDVCTAINARVPSCLTGIKRILYSPMNMESVSIKSLSSLAQVDLIVFYTHSGEEAGQAAFRAAGIRCPSSAVIPHALNSLNSNHLPWCDRSTRRTTARHALRHVLPLPDDAFLILNPNVDCTRKDVARTLAAFEIVSRLCPATNLVVKGRAAHHLFKASGFSQDRALRMLKAESHTTSKSVLTDEEVTLLLEACDVGVNTARTEGWGLSNFEHGFTGAPQVLPSLATLTEIWGDAAIYASSVGNNQYAHGSDAGSVADMIRKLVMMPQFFENMSCRAWQRTHDLCFSLENFADKWRVLLDNEIKKVNLITVRNIRKTIDWNWSFE